MTNNNIKTKKGFTIIEVVLVLAVAGLIFMMVFLALPALQRSQKDTQRRDQLSGLVTQIIQYQANNRNKLPTMSGTTSETVSDFNGDGKAVTGGNVVTTGWAGFYNNYLLAGGDVFDDPNGDQYKLYVTACNPEGGSKKNGVACSGGTATTSQQRNSVSFEEQDYTILILTNATCEGEQTVFNTGDRKVAVAYKLEGGGTFCQGN
ncbi:type II secretion system protein [Candidatus Saccharibacteria bacterium]|nr:type II secretion system protein [Candidatus Saccharibacteria bacterium]